jgi:hypothetical protein
LRISLASDRRGIGTPASTSVTSPSSTRYAFAPIGSGHAISSSQTPSAISYAISVISLSTFVVLPGRPKIGREAFPYPSRFET